ncbi:MAG: DUF4349 domain-containing protein [bacterium]|nr:DUF4349 domain-containing protein [bacterium]
MKTQKNLTLVLLLLVMLSAYAGCNKSKDYTEQIPVNVSKDVVSDESNSRSYDKMKTNEGLVKPVSSSVEKSFSVLERMIIKSGTMNMEVDKYDDAERRIKDEVLRFKGYITNSNSSVNVSGKKQGNIEARIPSANYDEFISSIGQAGKVISQNISGNDVTEEFIDLEARTATQRELERRLLQLLSEKTAKLVDVVEVEEKLSEVRENIESTEGRMKFLKDQSSFSTLNVSMFEPSLLQTTSGGGFFYEITNGFKSGLEGFTDVISWMIAFIIAFSPTYLFRNIVFHYKKIFT